MDGELGSLSLNGKDRSNNLQGRKRASEANGEPVVLNLISRHFSRICHGLYSHSIFRGVCIDFLNHGTSVNFCE